MNNIKLFPPGNCTPECPFVSPQIQARASAHVPLKLRAAFDLLSVKQCPGKVNRSKDAGYERSSYPKDTGVIYFRKWDEKDNMKISE